MIYKKKNKGGNKKNISEMFTSEKFVLSRQNKN